MALRKTDRLGRATFHYIASDRSVRPTPREIRWLKHLERHGPQSSQFLYELTRDTHSCKDTALRQLQKMRAGGFLMLPPQQRATERAEFKPYIYDLTKAAKQHLKGLGIAEPTLRPAGHWWHGFITSCVTGSIDIAAARAGVGYVPAHEILAIKGAELAIPHEHSILIPDQLFALNYGESFRVFALEVDRGTEPKISASKRKSWARSIAQYKHILENETYRSHYGLKANLLVLYVFTSHLKQALFLEMVRVHGRSAQKSILTQSVYAEQERTNAASVWFDLYHQPWERTAGGPVTVSDG